MSESFRAWLHDVMTKLDLWRGWKAMMQRKPRPFTGYQLEIGERIIKGGRFCVLGGRRVAKTSTISLFLVIRMAMKPTRVSAIPGGKLDQAKKASWYINVLASNSRVLKPLTGANRRTGLKWTITTREFANASSFSIFAPTVEGVQYEGADIAWFDESQQLGEEVWEAAGAQAASSEDGTWIFSGTATQWPSVLHSMTKKFDTISIPVQLAIDGGIVNGNVVTEERSMQTEEAAAAMWDCVWPDKSTRVLAPLVIEEIPENWRPGLDVVGMDNDRKPGHAWVRVIKYQRPEEGDVLVACQEGNLQSLQNVRAIQADVLSVEDGGANIGYVDWLRTYEPRMQPHCWTGKGKEENIELGVLFNEFEKLYIIPDLCPNLKKGLDDIEFRLDGTMIKGDYTHWVDAWLHALWIFR